MIPWGWLIPTAMLSGTLGAWIVAICVDSARRREAQEYDLTLRRIAKAQKCKHGR